jgi:hypothetical protein
MKQQYWIAIAAAVILGLAITSGVFIYRLGVLKEKNKTLNLAIEKHEANITLLNIEIAQRQAQNKALELQLKELEPQVVDLMQKVEQREVTILKTKNYGKKTIDNYLALPVEDRQREFAKLIR